MENAKDLAPEAVGVNARAKVQVAPGIRSTHVVLVTEKSPPIVGVNPNAVCVALAALVIVYVFGMVPPNEMDPNAPLAGAIVSGAIAVTVREAVRLLRPAPSLYPSVRVLFPEPVTVAK